MQQNQVHITELFYFHFKSMAVHLENGSLFFSGACLQPTMAQNMKLHLTRQNKYYNVTQRCSYSMRRTRAGKMHHLAFMSYYDLHIMYSECFALVT
jgi:hypothetical protein